MKTQVAQGQNNKSQSLVNEACQKVNANKPTFQFIDRRSETIRQKRFQEIVNNSSQSKKAAQLQMMFHHHALQKQALRKSPSSPVIQRAGSGGEKIGFDKTTSVNEEMTEEIRKGFELLMKSWHEVKKIRKKTKKEIGTEMADFDEGVQEDSKRQTELADEKQKLSRSAYNKKKKLINKKYKASSDTIKQIDPGGKGLTKLYYDKLVTDIKEEAEMLKEATVFKNGTLKFNNDEIIYVSDTKGDIQIALLKTGTAAFKASATTEKTSRRVFSKMGFEDETTSIGDRKEYVKDSRDTLTRRYAFVEKNYYQMMEFFMTDHMTGRFQQYMMSGGDRKPGVHKITTEMIKNVPKVSSPQLSDTQVAVAHQMYGSLPEQRGVSLSSTPKIGVTYANTGGNFRTDDGFKLKIDLARVPKDILFLNHYAQGGVSDMQNKDYSTTQTHKGNGRSYDYKYEESALHARELFLEHMKPEWVVEIEHHQKGAFKNREGAKTVMRESEHEDLLSAAKTAFGGDAYEKGFEIGVREDDDLDKLKNNPDYKKGKGTGAMVKEGHTKGIQVKNQKGVSSSDAAFLEVMNDVSIQDKMSPYHLGYLQARTGQALIKTVLEFKLLLNSEMELSDKSGLGGTYSIANNKDGFIIKRSYQTQMGQQKTKITTLPFKELRDASITYVKESDEVEVTIDRSSGDFSMLLPEAQAKRFENFVNGYIQKNAKRLTTEESSVQGGTHAMYFDAEKLKIERQFLDYMGKHKTKNSLIVLADISSVQFERDDATITITLIHKNGSYEMNVVRERAVEIRELLIQNNLDAKKLGVIPEKQ